METLIFPHADAFAQAAADRFAQAAQEAVQARGQFTTALTGGSSPEGAYRLLAEPAYRERVPWEQTYVFLGDERCVPFDDPRSNFGQARRLLLSHVPVPESNVFPVPTDAGDPAQIAALYAQTLADFFQLSPLGPPPALDFLWLGMGGDGHTASLFPGYPSLHETAAWVVSSPPGTLPPPVDRVTFTFPVINAARHTLMLATGDAKAEAARDVLEGHAATETRPAAGVRPVSGDLFWFLDTGASRLLECV